MSVLPRYSEPQIPCVTVTPHPRRRPNHYRYWPNIQRTDSNRRANGAGYRIRIGNFALEGRRVTVTPILHKRTFDIFSFGCSVVYPEILQIFQRCNHLLYPVGAPHVRSSTGTGGQLYSPSKVLWLGLQVMLLFHLIQSQAHYFYAKPQYRPLRGWFNLDTSKTYKSLLRELLAS